MHPYLTGLMAETHREDLLREAEQHRLVMAARAARPRRSLPQWKGALAQVGGKVRLLARPAPIATVGCTTQQACCPA